MVLSNGGFHAFGTFPLIFLSVVLLNPVKQTVFLAYGLLVCIYILYQGQKYWRLKLMKLKGQQFDQMINHNFFKSSKRNNVILIALMPVMFIVQIYISGQNFNADNLIPWALLANTFAIAEYINYYHWQLSIDNKNDLDYLIQHKKLKRSKLRNDLIEGHI